MINLTDLSVFLLQLEKDEFYGKVILSYQKGTILNINRDENIRSLSTTLKQEIVKTDIQKDKR